MARGSLAKLKLPPLARHALAALMSFLFPDWYGPSAKYRPEDHYMRGPGPKWRAKYPAEPAPSAPPAIGSRRAEER
jgi:hypothetical protein